MYELVTNRLPSIMLLLLLTVAQAGAQAFLQRVRLNDDNAGARQAAPYVAVDREGTVYVSWVESRGSGGSEIHLGRSTDGGKTFISRRIFSGGNVPAGMQRGVQFVFDRQNTIHMVWLEINLNPDVIYARSTDGGLNFTEPRSVGGGGGTVRTGLPQYRHRFERQHIYRIRRRP